MLAPRKLLAPATLVALLAAASLVMAGPGATLLDAAPLVAAPEPTPEAPGPEAVAPALPSPDADGIPDARDHALLDETLRAFRDVNPTENVTRERSVRADLDVATLVGNLTAQLRLEETSRAERWVRPAPRECRDAPAPERCCRLPPPREEERSCRIEQTLCVKATVKVGGVCVEVEYKCHLKLEHHRIAPRALPHHPRDCEGIERGETPEVPVPMR